jgi:hypothetical protein
MATATGLSTSRTVLFVLGRVVGAGLLGAMAGIHVYLWEDGYRTVSTIGPLFLINGIVGALLVIAVLVTPGRWLGWLSALSALFTLGTLGALALSLTTGLFGFTESMVAPLVTTTIVVEAAGVVELAALAALAWPLRAARR